MDKQDELSGDAQSVKICLLWCLSQSEASGIASSNAHVPHKVKGVEQRCVFNLVNLIRRNFIKLHLIASKQVKRKPKCTNDAQKHKYKPLDVKKYSNDNVNDRGNIIYQFHKIHSWRQEKEDGKGIEDSHILDGIFIFFSQQMEVGNSVEDVEG